MMEVAHDFTFRGLWDLRGGDCGAFIWMSEGLGSAGEDMGDSESTDTEASEVVAADAAEIEESLLRCSDQKKLRFFAWRAGELLAGGGTCTSGKIADLGRLELSNSPKLPLPVSLTSKIAPAVLGRPDLLSLSKVTARFGRAIRATDGLEAPLTTEDRLFETEWPRIVDMVLSVSEEMVESGRMYSTVSEKPTRARDGGR